MYELYDAQDAAPLGDITGLPQISLTEMQGGLRWVRSDIRSGSIDTIGTMTKFVLDPNGLSNPGDGIVNRGKAMPMLAMPADTNWVRMNVAALHVILVRDGGAAIDVIDTSSPSTIAQNAGPGGGYAILDGHPATVAAAQAIVSGLPGQPLPSIPGLPSDPYATPAPPTQTLPWFGGQLPTIPGLPSPGTPPLTIPGSVQPAPGPAPSGDKKLPGWVVPVAIAGGGLLLVGGVVLLRRKKRAMVANRRRRRRR